jgi:hypothetical protein
MDHGQRSRIHRMGIRAFWFCCTYEVHTRHTKSLPRVMYTEMSRAIEGLCMVADVSGERASHWYDILPAHVKVIGVSQLCKGGNESLLSSLVRSSAIGIGPPLWLSENPSRFETYELILSTPPHHVMSRLAHISTQYTPFEDNPQLQCGAVLQASIVWRRACEDRTAKAQNVVICTESQAKQAGL